MAISATHFELLKQLKARDVLPQGGSILEIGQANVYGDFDPQEIFDLLPDLERDYWSGFAMAVLIYRGLFDTTDIVSVDAGGPTAIKHDLNEPFSLSRKFTTVINHGTAEHIFNIAQVFRSMHDHCEVGGLMIHESPFTGWVDHGFYTLQPTLFWDLAQANGYEVAMVAGEHLASRQIIHFVSREDILEMRRGDRLPDNLMLFVVLRKVTDCPFVVPMQGIYTDRVSQQAVEAWRDLR